MTNKVKLNVVLYHAHCNDGKAAAAVAIATVPKPHICIPISYADISTPAETYVVEYMKGYIREAWGTGEQTEFNTCHIVDFAVHPDVIKSYSELFNHVMILDHHASAIEKYQGVELPSNVTTIFDTTRSGAQLTWDVLHNNEVKQDKRLTVSGDVGQDIYGNTGRPEFVDLVGFRDLWVPDWQKTYPKARPFFLATSNQDIGTFQRLLDDHLAGDDSRIKELVEEGLAIVSHIDLELKAILSTRQDFSLDYNGEQSSSTLINCFGGMVSDISEMAKESLGIDIAISYHVYPMGGKLGLNNVKLGIRSNNGAAKLIAEKLGGGGHPNAAGAYITMSKLMTMITSPVGFYNTF